MLKIDKGSKSFLLKKTRDRYRFANKDKGAFCVAILDKGFVIIIDYGCVIMDYRFFVMDYRFLIMDCGFFIMGYGFVTMDYGFIIMDQRLSPKINLRY